MESQGWSGYRGSLYDGLTAQRPTIQNMRFECISVARTFEQHRYDAFNRKVGDLIGIHMDYMGQLSNAFWLQRYIAPMWNIHSVMSANGHFRITFEDASGRDRDLFHCRFVSRRPEPVVVYSALSLRLIDINTHIEEITSLF